MVDMDVVESVGHGRLRRVTLIGWALVICLLAANAIPAQQTESTSLPVPPAAAGSDATAGSTGYRLDEFVRLAEENHPILRRDLARIEEARGQAVQAGLYPNPRLDSTNADQFAGRESLYSTGYLQTIVTGGKLKLDRAAAMEVVRQAELAYEQDRYDLVSRVRGQFYTVLAAQERGRVLEQTKQIVEQAEQTGDRLFKGGEGNRTDVLALQIETRRVDIALRNSMTLLAAGKRQLAALIGLPDLEIAKVNGNLFAVPPRFESETVRQMILSRNAQIEIAQVDISRRRLLLRRAEAEPIPNIDAMVGYQYAALHPNQQLLFYLEVPLPLWNRNQGGIAAAAAGLHESTEAVDVVQNHLLQQAGEALGRFQSAWEQEEEYRLRILGKAGQALELAYDGYRKGQFDFPRFLNAQRNLVTARLAHIDALDRLWSAAVDVTQLTQADTFPEIGVGTGKTPPSR